jgi:hypothetical protein
MECVVKTPAFKPIKLECRVLDVISEGKKIKVINQGKIINSLITNKFPDEPLSPEGKIFAVAKIIDGKIPLRQGNSLIPRQVDFVVTKSHELILGRKHTTLANNKSVIAAGQLKLNGQGQIRRIDNLSGHFRPTIKESLHQPEIFKELGLNLKGARINLYEFHVDPLDNLITSRRLIITKELP